MNITLKARIGVLIAAGIVLPAIGVAPQLQARLTGDTYAIRVAPVDPIDPFRGAYVDLNYPDLRIDDPESTEGGMGSMEDGDDGHDGAHGDVFIVLRKDGDVWVAADHVRKRPDSGPYLACNDRDWRIRCGIESFFLPQDKAKAMEADVAGGHAIATVRIDSRGHAALMGID